MEVRLDGVEVQGSTSCLTQLCILFDKKNNGGHFPGLASFNSLKSRNKDLLCRIDFTERQEAEGRGNSCEVFFLFFFSNPIRDLIIISLLAEKPNKWQEKESQLNINTHTHTHTHKDERSAELQSGC